MLFYQLLRYEISRRVNAIENHFNESEVISNL